MPKVAAKKTNRTSKRAKTANATVIPIRPPPAPATVRRVGLPYAELVAATDDAEDIVARGDAAAAQPALDRIANAQGLFLRLVIDGLYGGSGYKNPLLMVRLALEQSAKTNVTEEALCRLVREQGRRLADVVDLQAVRLAIRLVQRKAVQS